MAGSFPLMPGIDAFLDVIGIVTIVGAILFSGVIINFICDLIDGKDKK